jgi:predicted amidohydrolase
VPLGEPPGLGHGAGGEAPEASVGEEDGLLRREATQGETSEGLVPTEPAMSAMLAGVIQMTSTADVERNLTTAERLVAEAAGRGAQFVGLPENFGFLRSEGEPVPEPQDLDGPWVRRMAAVARRHALTLLLGSIPERIPGVPRIHNTSVLLGSDGRTLATYRKIHLFDIDLPGLEHLKESRSVAPGDALVVADAGFATIGLSICYDLRFPELYRELTRRGAHILVVPSAFTERTGKDHWEVLLRARAIENQTYVLAPAQVGAHGGGRTSHGHAMIVDPWGTIVAQAVGGEGVAVGPIDLAHLAEIRRQLPALAHKRLDGHLVSSS